MRDRHRLVAPAFALLLAACGSAGDGAEATTTSTGTETSTTSAPDTTTTTIGEPEMPDQDEVVQRARVALADRMGVTVDDVAVVRVRAVDWPDTSLGCPEEGMSYAQVITPGFQVLLQVESRVFDYHAGSDGEVLLCPSDERDGGYDFVPPPGIDQ